MIASENRTDTTRTLLRQKKARCKVSDYNDSGTNCPKPTPGSHCVGLVADQNAANKKRGSKKILSHLESINVDCVFRATTINEVFQECLVMFCFHCRESGQSTAYRSFQILFDLRPTDSHDFSLEIGRGIKTMNVVGGRTTRPKGT